MSLNGNGSLVIEGTSGNDAISIVSTATGVTVQSASLDAIKGNAKLWNTSVYSLRTADLTSAGGQATDFAWGPVKRVLVNGNGGSDAIAVDTATQAVTVDQGVDSRVILLKHNRSITDFASTALQGTYGGNNQTWQNAFEAQKASLKGREKNPVVFLGDSMVARFPLTGHQMWRKYFAAATNLGLVGDATSQVLYRVEHGLLDGLKPKVLVLEIGTNNISLSDNEHKVFNGVQSLLAAIRSRLPDTRILISSILPRADAIGNAGAARANALLKTLDDGNGVRFLDATQPFNSPKAIAKYLRSDGLHLNEHGYQVWGNLIAPLLDQMLHGSRKST